MTEITINEAAGRYLQLLARFPKINTRKDYEKRLSMLLAWCSMERIDVLEEIDFLQFLDWLFYDRGVSPRTRNNYRTWLRSFTSWARQQHLIEGDPMDGIAPMRGLMPSKRWLHFTVFLFLISTTFRVSTRILTARCKVAKMGITDCIIRTSLTAPIRRKKAKR